MNTLPLGHRSLRSALVLLPLVLAAALGCGGNDIPIGGDTGGGGSGASSGTAGDGGSGNSGGGGATCEVADCGPPLGMPNYPCPDGTMAGPTGTCLQTNAGCGWEVIECPSVECDPDDCTAIPLPGNEICEDGSVGGPTGKCIQLDGGCTWEIRECPPPAGYQWYALCGDPACMSPDPDDPNVPNCTADQAVGSPCAAPGQVCEPPGDTCGATSVCAATDPVTDECPISRSRHKDSVDYLDDRALERVRDQFLGMKMARWHYKSEPVATREHLGFIIDDQPNSPAVMGNGERVDLYGYTSMAAATIQVQQKQIDAMGRELSALREMVEKNCRSK